MDGSVVAQAHRNGPNSPTECGLYRTLSEFHALDSKNLGHRWAQSESPSGASADFSRRKRSARAECSFVEARAEGGAACDAQQQGAENCAPLCERQLPRSFGRSTASSKTPLCQSGSRTCCSNWTCDGTKRRFQATADRSLKAARTEDIKAIRGRHGTQRFVVRQAVPRH